MSKLLLAFPAFVVALFGIVLAIGWFSVGLTYVLLVAASMALFGWLIDCAARRWVITRRPSAAVWMMEFWILCPGAVAAVAAAILIVLNVHLKPGDAGGLTSEQKELMSAVLTALTALVTAAFIKAADDADSAWIAPHVRDAFYKAFMPSVPADQRVAGVHYFPLGRSELERWIYRETYGGVESWNFRDRHRRARGVHLALRNGDTPDPNRQ